MTLSISTSDNELSRGASVNAVGYKKTPKCPGKLPKKLHERARRICAESILRRPGKDANEEYADFRSLYQAKYSKAVTGLARDIDDPWTIYDFPAERGQSIRSINAIASTSATIRHRSRQTKGYDTLSATLSMVYKLGLEA